MSTLHGVDISTRYLGFDLCSPLIASPSPLTGSMDGLRRLEDAGVGAVVLPSLFEEDIETEEMLLVERLESGAGASSEAGEYFPDHGLLQLGIDRHLTLVEQAAQGLSIPVIASLNGYSPGGWVRYAAELVEAGACAIELNMYDLAVDPAEDSAIVEGRYLALVSSVVECVDVPIAVKMSPYFTALANIAGGLVHAGARGLVLFNRFYQPDLDLESTSVVPRLELSHPGEERLPLRWIAILRPQLPEISLALTTGVASGEGILKALMAGADVAMSTAELLRHGSGRAAAMLDDMARWMAQHDYDSVAQLRGSLARSAVDDPHAYERAQYRTVLDAWRP